MSKELEALERLWEETKGNPNTSSMSNRSDRDLIKQALTQPTLDTLRDEIIDELKELYPFQKLKMGLHSVYNENYTSGERVNLDYVLFRRPNLAHKITTYFMLLKEKENE